MCDLLVFALISSMLQCPITCYYIVNAQTERNFTYHTIGSKARQCQPRRNSFSSYMGMLTTAQVWAQFSHQNLYVPEKTYCVQRHCSASSCHTWSTWDPMKRSYAALYAKRKYIYWYLRMAISLFHLRCPYMTQMTFHWFTDLYSCHTHTQTQHLLTSCSCNTCLGTAHVWCMRSKAALIDTGHEALRECLKQQLNPAEVHISLSL